MRKADLFIGQGPFPWLRAQVQNPYPSIITNYGLPRWLRGKPGAAGAAVSVPALRKSPGEGNGNSLQCSCLENLMDRGTRQATVHGVAESNMTEQLNNNIGRDCFGY